MRLNDAESPANKGVQHTRQIAERSPLALLSGGSPGPESPVVSAVSNSMGRPKTATTAAPTGSAAIGAVAAASCATGTFAPSSFANGRRAWTGSPRPSSPAGRQLICTRRRVRGHLNRPRLEFESSGGGQSSLQRQPFAATLHTSRRTRVNSADGAMRVCSKARGVHLVPVLGQWRPGARTAAALTNARDSGERRMVRNRAQRASYRGCPDARARQRL
jgi:hypothetical protein